MNKNIKARVVREFKKLEHGKKRHRIWLRTKGLKILMPLIYRLRVETK